MRLHLRVVGGMLGGRRFSPVPGRSTRPTADRVREALFSRLESRYGLRGARVLDLFAGTGALGIEALSRGAESAVCVESERRARAVLETNLRSLGLRARARVIDRDFRRALEDLARSGEIFDGVFIDPPYRCGLVEEAVNALLAGGLLATRAWLSVETARDEEVPDSFGTLTRLREDRYGDTKLSLYERREQGEDTR